MRTVPIEHFTSGLCSIPEPEFTVGVVLDFLRRHPVDEASLSPYLHFSRNHYTRNLIFRNELFELIAVCWDVGQASQVHNHCEQNCWMSVPAGRLRVQNYRVVERDERRRYCRVEESDTFDIHPREPAAEVDPAEPIHRVLNLAEFGGRAVSLHVYSRPYDYCTVYSTTRHDYREMPLTFFSEYGKVCEGARP